MTLIIIFLKLYHVLNSINSLVDKKYFLFYINNIIDSQREIKTQFNELNNHDIVVIGNDPLLFLRIYTETKVSQGILVNKTIILDGNLTNDSPIKSCSCDNETCHSCPNISLNDSFCSECN